MVGSTASAKALASAKSAEVPKALQSALAEAVIFLQLFDFKKVFNCKGNHLTFHVVVSPVLYFGWNANGFYKTTH